MSKKERRRGKRAGGRTITKIHLFAGPAHQLQSNVRRVSVHDRQAVRHQLRHWRQGDPVWAPQRHLQALAAVARQGHRGIRAAAGSLDGAGAVSAEAH